ncbi:MAG: exodeoxyribonuclease VII large subunit [Vampirovibrionales bacterium]
MTAKQLGLNFGFEALPPPPTSSASATPSSPSSPSAPSNTACAEAPTAYSVRELTQLLSHVWKQHPITGGKVCVQGEASNVKQSTRGHVYFTLKDAEASIACVVWASNASKLKFKLQNGLALTLTATVDMYAPSGTYSLVCSKLDPQGQGALQLALEQLKATLHAEGCFAPERKRPLPLLPKRIGIVTSPTGAVLHDMLRTIRAKNTWVHVVLAPALVQGEGAAASIAQAIEALQAPELALDALIVARGGGSAEDLFCFNEAPVVRAIVASHLPVVTGLGHEPDFSLADAAADYSAQTPTGAADALIPDVQTLVATVDHYNEQLHQQVQQRLVLSQQALDTLNDQLQNELPNRLQGIHHRLEQQRQHLCVVGQHGLEPYQHALAQLVTELEAYSPLATLKRGYALVHTQQGTLLRRPEDVAVGEVLHIRLQAGELTAQAIHPL